MKVKFNGMVLKRTKGCGCGGKSKTSEYTETYFWAMSLPSGIHKTFRRGKVEEVSAEDAVFLLDYQYQVNGETRKAFEVVDDG